LLRPLRPEDALRLRTYLKESGYTNQGIVQLLGTKDLPSAQLGNVPWMLHAAGEGTPLSVLVRLFYCGAPVSVAEIGSVLPGDVLSTLAATSLLVEENGLLRAPFMLTPFENLYVLTDHSTAIERGEDSNAVLFVNPTTFLLHAFTIRRKSRRTLEVGTGCGAIAFAAAGFSDYVVATDLNPRAVDLARFGAWLNGLSNVDCRTGNLLEPVAGETFDLILSNPPFFITPDFESDRVFCENPDILDQLSFKLLQKAPAHLEEGGYFEMLFDWAEVEGEPWSERMSRILYPLGCDAHLIVGARKDPARYAYERIRELDSGQVRHNQGTFDKWLAYYRQHRVQAIYRGFLVLRKRSGPNWFRTVEFQTLGKHPMGHMIERAFAAQDFLLAHPDDQSWFNTRFRLAPYTRLQQRLEPRGGVWRGDLTEIVQEAGFPWAQKVNPLVAEFIAQFTGEYTLGQMADEFSRKINVDSSQVRTQCLDLARRLVERCYLLWETGEPT
jgi:SAM-dependent methyltransferase